MNLDQLRQFLVDSNMAGYAGGNEKKWLKEADGSTTIPYSKGEWTSHDNFFGGEPYGGRIVVSYKNKAVWMMVYYGWVEEGINPDLVYGILREALKFGPEDLPLRGPKEFKQGELEYKNKWTGNLERYAGEEKIFRQGKLIYKANYLGGMVDKRAGV